MSDKPGEALIGQGRSAAGRETTTPPGPPVPQPAPAESLSALPPLSVLAAVSAVIATAVNRLILPASADPSRYELLLSLGRWGSFASNLTGVAGLVALSCALFEFVRSPDHATLRRRLLIATFAGILLPTVALSTFFPREQTTGEMVLFGIGAANVLVVALVMNAARFGRSPLTRLVPIAFAAMALCSMLAQVLQIMARQRLEAWQLSVATVVRNVGEVGDLLGLLGAAAIAFPLGRGRRQSLARAGSIAALVLAVAGFAYARATLRGDFVLLLHHAQRVSLFIDSVPLLYVLPFSVSAAAALGAVLGSDRVGAQVGLGLILLLTAGYAPNAPERLLTLTLSMVLVARAVIADGSRRSPEEASGELPMTSDDVLSGG